MNLSLSLTVAKFACLEMARAKWWLLAALVVAVAAALAEFGASVAITESAAHRLVFYASSVRIGAVFVVGLIVATSVLRDIDEKGVEMSLSRPLSRLDWYIGKFLAYAMASVLFAIVATAPLMVQVPAAAVSWGFSLCLELLIVVAAALAFTVTLRQIPTVILSLAGFYLLARAIAALVLMSTGPTVDLSFAAAKFIALFVNALSYLLPDLDRFTDSAWLIGAAPGFAELGALAAQTLIYVILLIGVGLFDLYRRNF